MQCWEWSPLFWFKSKSQIVRHIMWFENYIKITSWMIWIKITTHSWFKSLNHNYFLSEFTDMTVHSRNNYDLTYCWAVPRNYRRTEVLVFHGTSTVEDGHGTTAIPQCHEYRVTTIRYLPTNKSFQRKFSCEKPVNLRVNKLEVFK